MLPYGLVKSMVDNIVCFIKQVNMARKCQNHRPNDTTRIVSASSVESDLGCTSMFYFENVTHRHRNQVNKITNVLTLKQAVTTFHNKHGFK